MRQFKVKTPIAELTGFTKRVNALAFSPDSRTLLSGSHDGQVSLWEVSTATVRAAFDWGIGPVTALSFAPEGLTCSADSNRGKIAIWDMDV